MCDAEIALVPDKPYIREQEATGSLEQRLGFAKPLLPAIEVEQESREWFDKNACLVPNEVLVYIFSDEDIPTQKLMSVQGSGAAGNTSQPEVCVNLIKTPCSQLS